MNIRKILTGGVSSVVVSLVLSGSAIAAPLNSNGSFETGTDPGSYSTLVIGDTESIDDWTVSNGSVDYIGTYWQASDGTRSLDLSGNEAGAVSQTIDTVVGETYRVRFDLAGNPAGGSTVKTVSVDAGDTPGVYTFDTTGKTLEDMGWETQIFEFTATTETTTLTFSSLNEDFWGPALDNVNVVQVVMLTNKDQCKNDGWMGSNTPAFRNQGDCVSYFQSNAKAKGNRKDNL